LKTNLRIGFDEAIGKILGIVKKSKLYVEIPENLSDAL
jgi:hypothetical protein